MFPLCLCVSVLAVLIVLLSLALHAQTEPKQITVYTPQTSFTLPVLDRDGREYVGLAELLEPIGSITAKLEGKKWKLRFEDREAQFQLGSSKAKVHKRQIDLTAPFLVESERGLVPVRALSPVLGLLLPGHTLSFHAPARRLFIDKPELHYSAELREQAPPGQLVITFSAPVNPFVAAEPGKLRLVFRREPLLPSAAETQTFKHPTFGSLAYSEANGLAELTVTSSGSLLASFSADRKTITIAPPPQQPPLAALPSIPAPAPAAPAAATPAPAPPQIVVLIDAAHGGDDRGATLSESLFEKDVTLALARRLHKELAARGIAAKLLRDGDSTLSGDQRAAAVNLVSPGLYVAVHAAGAGSGIHVITSRLAPSLKPAVFLPWDSAQASFVTLSRQVAQAVTTELLKHDLPAMELSSSLQPLDSIAAPALAIELGPLAGGKPEDLNVSAYQQSVCAAIADTVAASKSKLPRAEPGR